LRAVERALLTIPAKMADWTATASSPLDLVLRLVHVDASVQQVKFQTKTALML
jgi:hypothetical protein